MNLLKILNKSIKTRVIVLLNTLLFIGMVLVTLLVVYIVDEKMSHQTYALLSNKSESVHKRIEQRFLYLFEDTEMLTKNELMVNALTDAEGRDKYLTPLVENFMLGKNVVSLNIVDFDGKAIFQTQENIPRFNESKKLRNALVMGKIDYYLEEENHNLVVVAPIEYYSTTQGAAIVVFDLSKIIDNNAPEDKNIYLQVFQAKKVIYSHNMNEESKYKITRFDISAKPQSVFWQLGLSLELGMDSRVYAAPVKEVVLKLLLLSIVVMILGFLVSLFIVRSITNPILELYKRVTSPDIQFCSPLNTSDELEELAKAFDEHTLKLQYQAEHDALTALPNRVLFIDRIKENIKTAPRSKNEFAVLFIDLDRFKEVNDSFGHNFGDKLLLIVGKYLKNILRESDSVARMGGDEFTILLNNIENINAVAFVLDKIMQLFQEPFKIEGHKFYMTCSIGVAIYPLNGATPELLLKNADAAMYKAKDEGRNNYKFYTDDMTEKAYERIVLEKELREAILKKEFEVFYQPQVNMIDETIMGMEALIRWNHPKKGLVPPNVFIPLAEETGLIIDIDKQMMDDAMKQYQKWIEDGYDVGILSMNLSIIQLNHVDFLPFVSNAALAKENIMFEVTETQVMKNPENAIVTLQQLKDLGIKLAVDDFGTGYSSLSYLKQLPIDKLKIDQSFTQGVTTDNDDAELTRAVISIAKSLHLDIIAEGVETPEQSEFLVENGCVEAQGYLYYKPQSSKEITRKLLSLKEKFNS